MNPKRLILLCCLLLSGCSMIDLAYNNAPGFVAGELEDVFALEAEQSELLDLRMQTFFDWHRNQELGRYSVLLKRTSRAADDGISAAEFLELNREIRQAYERLMQRMIDDFGDLALTLTPEQIDAFDRYFRDRSRRFTDYLEMTMQQREIYRLERDLERLEDWFGDFDYFLEKRVRERLQGLPDIRESWIRFRERRHVAILQALRNAKDEDRTRAELTRLLISVDTDYARDFEPERQAYWRELAAAVEDISDWLEPRHRKTMLARLENYTRAVDRLSDNI